VGFTAIADAPLAIKDEAGRGPGQRRSRRLPGRLLPSRPELADLRFPPAAIPLQKTSKYSAIWVV
jgi:hypothetical protein